MVLAIFELFGDLSCSVMEYVIDSRLLEQKEKQACRSVTTEVCSWLLVSKKRQKERE
jgi:hypothetical protein